VDDWTASEREVMETLASDEADAVLTVVGVEGSAYRRPGTKLPLRAADDDPRVADLVERATDRGPFVERWNLTEGEGWGLGVRSNGVVDVLVEPRPGAYRHVAERYLNRSETTVCTVVASQRPDVAVADRRLVVDGRLSRDGWPDELTGPVRRAADRLEPGDTDAVTVVTAAGDVRVFLEFVAPPPRLLVVGAASDVVAVEELAERVGFEALSVGVEGTRPRHVGRVVDDASDVRSHVDDDTFVVVMTHDFETDRRVLAELRGTDAPYVGVLGPPKRFAVLTDALAESGVGLDEDDRSRTFAPAGLDVGGDGPRAVALSVVAEVAAVANGRDGGHMDDAADRRA
jgi:xanthine dehydrogenase accessory factor